MDVPELRMPVSKVLDLGLAKAIETMITLALITLLVLPLAIKDTKNG